VNNQLEQCINRVQDELKTIETSLADTSNHLTSAVEQKAESLEAGWKNALAKCDAKREVEKPKKASAKKKGKKAVDEAASDETRTGSTDLPGKLPRPLNSARAA
jgi:murein L,D-transpeptidase YafK